MKTIRFAVQFVLLGLMIFYASCRYEEGPMISFLSSPFRIGGQYHVSKIVVDNIDQTQNYVDSCNCNFLFEYDDKTIYGYGVHILNCRSISSRDRINGFYLLENKSTKIFLDFKYDPVKDSIMRDSIFGYGPFNSGYTSEWEIVKLEDMEMVFEGVFMGKMYRIELQEFEY